LRHEARMHFQRALGYLEDIQRLSEQNVSPLIRQAIYNFQQSDGLCHKSLALLGEYPQMLYFWKSFLENLKQRLMDRRELENVHFSFSDADLNLAEVEALSSVLPSFVDVLCNLTFQNDVHMDFSGSELCARGKIKLSSDLENRRTDLYRLTRWFLKKEMILTFSLDKIEDDCAEIQLRLKFADQNNQIMLLDSPLKKTPLVGLSASLVDYKVSHNFASRLGRHLCIEITDDFGVEKHYRMPKRICSEKSQAEIMHFAFLFRPVSFIIPRAGRLIAVDDLMMLGGTGRDIYTAQQEVEESNRSYFFIDILSLMSC
jgi:hypothetical protein